MRRKVINFSLVILLVTTLAVSGWLYIRPVNYLTVVVCDVGQGDAILLRTPNGSDILIDGGPPDAKVIQCLGRWLPPWDRTIELVLLTHGDADHVGGLIQVARRYKLLKVIDNKVSNDTPTYKTWLSELDKQKVSSTPVHVGDMVNLQSEIGLQILWPPLNLTVKNTNDAMIVSRLVFNNTAMMLTGDDTFAIEDKIIASKVPLESQLLKVAHHGSRYATSAKWLAAVNPTAALISVGANNTFNHPHPVTLRNLQKFGAQIWRTDQSNDLVWRSNGQLWQRLLPAT